MAVRSRETLRRLPLLLECDPVYTRCGWLFLVDEEHAARGSRTPRCRTRRASTPSRCSTSRSSCPGSTRRESPSRSTSPTPASPTRWRRRTPTSRPCWPSAAARCEGTPVEAVELAGDRVRGVRVGGRARRMRQRRPRRRPLDEEARRRCRARAAARDHPRAGRRLRDGARADGSRAPSRAQIDPFYLRPAPEHGEAHLLVGRGYPEGVRAGRPGRVRRGGRRAFEQDVHERVAGAAPPARRACARVGGRVGLYDNTPGLAPDPRRRSTVSRASSSRRAAAATASSSGLRSARWSPATSSA